jgi:hypothetical protein
MIFGAQEQDNSVSPLHLILVLGLQNMLSELVLRSLVTDLRNKELH